MEPGHSGNIFPSRGYWLPRVQTLNTCIKRNLPDTKKKLIPWCSVKVYFSARSSRHCRRILIVVDPGYNDVGLRVTSSIASDIPYSSVIMILVYNDTKRSESLHGALAEVDCSYLLLKLVTIERTQHTLRAQGNCRVQEEFNAGRITFLFYLPHSICFISKYVFFYFHGNVSRFLGLILKQWKDFQETWYEDLSPRSHFAFML